MIKMLLIKMFIPIINTQFQVKYMKFVIQNKAIINLIHKDVN